MVRRELCTSPLDDARRWDVLSPWQNNHHAKWIYTFLCYSVSCELIDPRLCPGVLKEQEHNNDEYYNFSLSFKPRTYDDDRWLGCVNQFVSILLVHSASNQKYSLLRLRCVRSSSLPASLAQPWHCQCRKCGTLSINIDLNRTLTYLFSLAACLEYLPATLLFLSFPQTF